MTRTPDFTDYRYVGKEGKMHVVTDGLSVRYLNAREFKEFSRQIFGLTK
tara:strand:+ start:177 stop:323 length:147 start_codon:yes stop_codon:yes gene_type:complete